MREPSSFFERVGVLRPLRIRDFRLLWLGQTISFVGDGVYTFAVAWLVYRDLDLSPAAFSLVGAAWSLPQVLLLMATGALSDRMDRRHLMILGDLLRLVAIAAVGVLVSADAITLPWLIALVFVYGAGQALFGPAFNSIIPMIVPQELLVQANSIGQVVRPLSFIVIGPIVGAILVSALGTGGAFLFDASTFLASAVCVWMMRVRRDRLAVDGERPSLIADIREGVRYVRGTRWILMGLLGGFVSLFCVWGPWETLVPFVISRDLNGSELQLALVFGAGGVGSVIAGVVMAQRGLPRKPLTTMYLAWAIGMGMTAGFGLISSIPQGMLVAFVAESCIAILVVIWFTMLQRLVPHDLLGRVSSLDWMITIMGAPVSFLVVGPLAARFGADVVLIAAGLLGAASTLFFLTRRGALDPERDGSLAEPPPVSP